MCVTHILNIVTQILSQPEPWHHLECCPLSPLLPRGAGQLISSHQRPRALETDPSTVHRQCIDQHQNSQHDENLNIPQHEARLLS